MASQALQFFGVGVTAQRPDGTRQVVRPIITPRAALRLFDRFFVNSEASPDATIGRPLLSRPITWTKRFAGTIPTGTHVRF